MMHTNIHAHARAIVLNANYRFILFLSYVDCHDKSQVRIMNEQMNGSFGWPVGMMWMRNVI